MILLAIDPGTNAMGIAIFKNDLLVEAGTIHGKGKDRLTRIENMLDRLAEVMYFRKPDILAVEDPLLKGKANAAIERIKGSIEALAQVIINWNFGTFTLHRDLYYYGPTHVKRGMGHGDLDKPEMAKAALELARDAMEMEIIGRLIDAQDWDATDAICIGLVHLKRGVFAGV